MSLFGGGRDHPPHEHSEFDVDYKDSWSMFDVIMLLILIVIPVVGIAFGL